MLCIQICQEDRMILPSPHNNLSPCRRSLILSEVSPKFIQLGSTGLLAFSWRPKWSQEDHVPYVADVANLTTLTRLELCRVLCNTGLEALQGLNLEELVLVNCSRAAEKLIVPGALTYGSHSVLNNAQLTSLQKLCIIEHSEPEWESVEAFTTELQDPESAKYRRAVELH